jgi:hypothetical protein
MKIAVVTASVGANELREPPTLFKDVDFHAFVDEQKVNVEGVWKRQKFIDFSSDPVYKNRRNAKIYKVLPHLFVPGYDYYIWIDSTHYVGVDPHQIIDEFLQDSDIGLFQHPERNCVYQEAELIKQVNFDYHELVDAQMEFYQSIGYPRDNGLFELPCRIQRNTSKINEAMLSWWEMICMYSSRDQLSLPYVLAKHNIKPSIIPGFANRIAGNQYLPQYVGSNHSRTNNV